ncbi:MAG TPA: HEAT repeat domain-containing protein [Myxococcota bacterium]|nr:HEAT repeat domain-containing protein [Myxococcota bacterium]
MTELRRALADPGYTPSQRAFGALLPLLAEPELAARAERALRSAGLPAALFAARALPTSPPPQGPALVRIVGRALRSHDEAALLDALQEALRSPDPETRRQAAQTLGKSGRAAAEPALLACLGTSDPRLLRSVVEALGKVGSEHALSRLRALAAPARLAPVVERACLILERTLQRTGAASALALDVALPATATLVLSCRAGLAQLLAEEAQSLGARRVSDSEVSLEWGGTLGVLLSLRLALSVSLSFRLRPASATPDAVVRTLLQPQLVDAVRAWTHGTPRFRLVWAGRGHRRADTWKVARGLRDAGSPLLNDPTRAPWGIEARDAPQPRLLLTPVVKPDPRFEYRGRDVPGASHPTVAAALARVGGVRSDDVIWDPFAGSGLELIERAKLGPFRALFGTDIDPRALSAARENAARAGLESAVQLVQADARAHRVSGLTLVITNPPMGRRVHRARGLSTLLAEVLRNVAEQLTRGGRMVWLSPFAEATARVAADAGLRVERLGAVDLGGFAAELQRFTKP